MNAPRTARSVNPAIAQAHALLKQRKVAQAEQLLAGLLEQSPAEPEALRLLIGLRQQAGDDQGVEALYRRMLRDFPRDEDGLCDYGLFLFDRGRLQDAARVCEQVLKFNQRSGMAHNLLGMVLVKTGTLQDAEQHLRLAVYAEPRAPLPAARLAAVLRTLGRMDESAHFFRVALSLDPQNIDALQGWIKMEEARRDFAMARRLLDYANTLQPGHPYNLLSEAVLERRDKHLEPALACLDRVDPERLPGNGKSLYWFERGRVLDGLKRYPDAFAAFERANRAVVANEGRSYHRDNNRRRLQACRFFFTRERMQDLPRARARDAHEVLPIFIVGFPRSGTSMVEQILSAHPHITAGDELVMMDRISRKAPKWMGSRMPYPECLGELAQAGKRAAVQRFRDHYTDTVKELGILNPWERRMTDKMPLNEVHLGLINLVFPDAPVVHLLRHPLDVLLSSYFNDLRHGDNYSYDLQDAAHHYLHVMELVEHYRAELDHPYLAVRYEDVVADVEGQARRMLEFLGEPWEPACIDFHLNRRQSRTASYAQVTEKVYTRSVARYRNYLALLEPVIPLLEPVIRRLGYTLEG